MAILLVLAVGVGITLGMLGGGGAILTVPLLLYVAHMGQREAIVCSLFLVGVTSAVSLASHRKSARFTTGIPFAVASMAASYIGGRISYLIPPRVLLFAFLSVMIAAGIAMLRKRKAASTPPKARSTGLLVALGLAVGMVSGLVGAGGGFLIVPALNIFGGLVMAEAIATSLFVLVLQTSTALLGHVSHTSIPWHVALPVTGAAIVGSLVGSRIGKRAAPETLRRAFAILILLVATLMVVKELMA